MSMNESIVQAKQRPILIGLLAVVGVLSTGMTIAFATGMTAPELAHAIIVTPPCCVTVPPPPVIPTPPPVVVPPPPPPVIDTTPPCCTTEPPAPVPPPPPPPVTPPTPPPVIDTTPPCCTTEPPAPTPPPPPPPVTPPTPPPVIDTTPPCCTTTPPPPVIPPVIPPITPPVIPPVVPPVVPPTNPPVQVAPTCLLTITPTAIQLGGSATLTWRVTNSSYAEINQGIGGVDATGSITVSPRQNTTYTLTARGLNGQTINCHATITVTVTPPPPPTDVCPNIPGNQATIPSGMIKDAQGNCVTPEEPPPPPTDVCPNIPGNQATIPPGKIKDSSGNCVEPPPNAPQCIYLRASDTNIDRGEEITLSWKTENATSISINQGVGEVTPVSEGSVRVSPNDDTTYVATVKKGSQSVNCEVSVNVDDDHGGGGSSRRSPRVSLDDLPRPDELPFSFVYLDEIPYTGIELGPMGMVLYWFTLIGASAGLAYFVVYQGVPFAIARLRGEEAVHEVAHHAEPAHAEMTLPTGPAEVAKAYSAYEGFKSFAQGGTLSIDDIVSGLAREQHAPVEVATVAPSAALPSHEEVATPKQEAAPAAASFETTYDVPGFVSALLSGNRDATFDIIRQVTRAGDSAEEFLTHAVVALDDAYRAKLEGTAVHPAVAALTKDAAPAFLEKVIGALTAAVDGTYSTGVTGVKLAVTRALSVVNG